MWLFISSHLESTVLSEFLLAAQNLNEERNKKLVCGAFVEGREVKRELFSSGENYLYLFHIRFSKLIFKDKQSGWKIVSSPPPHLWFTSDACSWPGIDVLFLEEGLFTND